jgi:hypothetical protein
MPTLRALHRLAVRVHPWRVMRRGDPMERSEDEPTMPGGWSIEIIPRPGVVLTPEQLAEAKDTALAAMIKTLREMAEFAVPGLTPTDPR